jgi:hypothetical protein
MFQALLAHPQEVLHKQHLVTVCVLCQSAATRIGVEPNKKCIILVSLY